MATNDSNNISRAEARLLERIEGLRDEIIELCRQLVRANTVNPYAGDGTEGNEAEGQRILEAYLKEAGLRTELFDVPDDIFALMGVVGPQERDFRGRPNLVAEWSIGRGPALVINGHMDTVGAAGMEFEPFGAEVREGAIWGRGTSDCKGGLSATAVALRVLLEECGELSGRIVFQSVVEEECSGAGAGTLTCIQRGYTGDAVLVIDGSGLVPTWGCLGCLTVEILVRGRSGHGSYGGVNAIEKALVVKEGWDRFVEARQRRFPDCATNLGVFKAGSTPAVVPGEAVMVVNVNYLLAEAEASRRDGTGWGGALCLRELREALAAVAQRDAWLADNPPELEVVKDLYPFQTPASEPFVHLVAQAASDVMKSTRSPEVLPAWFDAAHFAVQTRGPVMAVGCGLPGQAHSETEHVLIDDLVREAQIVALTAVRYLGAG